MSTILDALRRGRSRAMARGSATSAQTDAVLETLGHSRRRHPTRVDRIRRLFTLVMGGALIVVLLWGAVVWLAQKPAVRTATAANSGTTVAPGAAPSRAWRPPSVAQSSSRESMGAPASASGANAVGVRVPTASVVIAAAKTLPTKEAKAMPASAGDLLVQPSRRVEASGMPQPPATAPSRSALSAAAAGSVSDVDHFKLALYYQRTGDFENALIQYRAVLQRDPLNLEAHNNLGLLYRDKALLDEAVREFQAAIAIDRRYVKAHNNLGVAYLSQHKSDAAISEFKTALTLDPRNIESLVNLALADKDTGRREEARASLTRAIDLDARNAEAHYNLALLSDEIGDRPQALAHYRAFLQLGAVAHPELAADVSKRIETLGR